MTRRRDLLAAVAALAPLGLAAPAHAAFRGTIERDLPTAEPVIEEAGTWSDDPAPPRPAINIVIDDLGNQLELGRRAIALPVTCSFLPHTLVQRQLAAEAHALGREMILHTPMQSIHGAKLGPGGLTVEMSSLELRRTMNDNFSALPRTDGVSNHMGSLLTRHPGQMQLVMESVRGHHGGFFLDSVTTSRSVAFEVARENGLPASRRNVFLDHICEPKSIHRQFRRLVARAKRHGTALAIGHPHPDTLAVLERELPRLADQGVDLVTTHRLIALHQERDRTWQPV
ncbi:divergent polysaccharide deacetylase family protein [Endothiovibrio diazotrophicus]